MAGDEDSVKAEAVDAALNGMKLEEQLFSSSPLAGVEDNTQSPDHPTSMSNNSLKDSASTKSTPKANNDSTAPTPKSDDDAVGGGVTSDITVQIVPGTAPKLSRKASSKMIRKPAPLFDHLPDATEESKKHFTPIQDCSYMSKSLGSSDHDTLGCDCSPEYKNGVNHACGEDSDCINRATKMECVDDECNCGAECQNQRFQRRQWAKVSVIKTEKKGFGLRADVDLQPNDFIFEYIGEVIAEGLFRKRTRLYNDEGIKHFYFMSLQKNVFVDATKKGNLGRFCNHSCNPNCYVDKWVVGDKLRMGIFAERGIKAGEELVFNYNVDRYGADPQPCYCGETNCTGFIGGKTQTERATKLSHAVIEALGIEDGDGWDIAVPKKVRKKKQGEDDEEYVSNVEPRGLEETGVTKVMATLMQCKEKWVAVKLLSRVQRCDDERVRNRVVRMHGYQILRSTLTTWKDDNNIVLQILDILYKLPSLTRNKIVDSKIETAVSLFVDSDHQDIAIEAKRLLNEWSKLEVGYRIPRKKFDPNAHAEALKAFERSRRGSDSRPVTPEKTFVAPSGPRSNIPQRNNSFYRPTPPPRPPRNKLPPGWQATFDDFGKPYYYTASGQSTWQRPNEPAPIHIQPPPPPAAPGKANQKHLQSIIDSITKIEPASQTASPAPKDAEMRGKEKKKGKDDWRSWPIEKQMRAYETLISKIVIPQMSKFRDQLSKDELKKFAKEVGKTLTASDFKHHKVEDLEKIPENKVRAIKDYATKYFKKAVTKKTALKSQKADRKSKASNGVTKSSEKSKVVESRSIAPRSEEMDMEVSDDDGVSGQIISMSGTPVTPAIGTPYEEGLGKRKRSNDEIEGSTPADTPIKRFKESSVDGPAPPPPPPPPPSAPMTLEEEAIAAIAAQEEELMLECEEAVMRDEEVMHEYNGLTPFNGNHFKDRNYYGNGFNSNSHPNSNPNSRPNSRQSLRRDSRRDSRQNSGFNSRPVSRDGPSRPVSRDGPSRPVSRNGMRGGAGHGVMKMTADSDSPRGSQSPHMPNADLGGIHPDRRRHLSQPLDADLEGLHPDRRRQLLGL